MSELQTQKRWELIDVPVQGVHINAEKRVMTLNKAHFWVKIEGDVIHIFAKPPLSDMEVSEQLKTEMKP